MPVGKDRTAYTFTMPKDIKAKLEEIAIEENRSLSNLIITILMKYIKEREKDES